MRCVTRAVWRRHALGVDSSHHPPPFSLALGIRKGWEPPLSLAGSLKAFLQNSVLIILLVGPCCDDE